MCGIFGFISKEELTQQELSKISTICSSLTHRGKSCYGLYTNTSQMQYQKTFDKLDFNAKHSNEVFFHALHAINDEVPQPLLNNGNNSDFSLVFNGELYNMDELNKSLNTDFENDTQLLQNYLDSFSTKELLEKTVEIFEKLNGDYACVYKRDQYYFISRDILGIKPLWYYEDYNTFILCSENKTQISDSFAALEEVNPKEILIFNIQDFSIQKKKRTFFSLQEELKEPLEILEENTWKLLVESVKKRIPKDTTKKIGLLFSGGIDSTVLALILKQLNIEFTCYTAKLNSKVLEEAEDVIYATNIAKKYDLDLKINEIQIEDLEKLTKEVISIINETDYIKVSVALPFLAACRLAKEDNIDIMFSGLGSEEIFAGYRRHKQAENINQECVEGLNILHIRDLYRDDVITMSCTQELRVPFLDNDLIKYTLNIPPKFKLDVKKAAEIKDEVYKKPYLNALIESKIILRNCAKKFLNLEEEFANRQKKAAQYGSKFDKGLLRLAKDKGVGKQEYLDSLV